MADETEVELPEISVVIPTDKQAGAGEGDSTDTSTDSGLLNSGDSGGSSPGNGTGGSGSGQGRSNPVGDVNTNRMAYTIPDLDTSRKLLPSVAPAWRYIAIMPNITTKLSSGLSVSEGGASYNSANKLSSPNIPIARCESVDIPPVSIDTDQRFGGGTKIYVARFVNFNMITLNFYEDEGYSVSKYLWAWHNSIVSPEKLFYLPKDYKKDIKVWAFNNRSNTSPALQVDFIECFPSISGNGLSYSLTSNNFLIVSAEFTVDSQLMNFSS